MTSEDIEDRVAYVERRRISRVAGLHDGIAMMSCRRHLSRRGLGRLRKGAEDEGWHRSLYEGQEHEGYRTSFHKLHESVICFLDEKASIE